MNLYDIVKQKNKEQSPNGALPNNLEENFTDLQIGDPVEITGDVQFNGATGDVVELGKDGRFVIVDLYNHGKHSFHSSDVSYNNYADSDDEEARMYDAGEFGDKLNEFAPSDDNGDNEPDEYEILHRLAAMWWLGTEQQMVKAQRTLASMGWEIGEDEGYDDGGVFVVRANDEHGKSYISWPHEDLQLNEQGVAEGQTPEQEIERLKLRQNAEHGGASLKRQAATQARIRELEKQIKDKKGVAEGSGNGYYYLQGGIEQSNKFASAEEAEKQVVAFGNEARVPKVTLRFKAPGAPAQTVKTFSINNEQGVAESIPYALSAANANAEFERTKTFVPRGYKGRVDTEVSGKEEYNSVMSALNKLARAEGQHVECGLSGNKMSIFSKTMDSEALDDFIDMALEDFDQGLEEGGMDSYEKDVWASQQGFDRPRDHRGLGQELAHERNNLQVAINGKPWKVFPGRGTADSQEEWKYLQSMKEWAAKKSAQTGKKWTVYLTGAEPTLEESDISGLLAAANLNKAFIITAELAEGGTKRFKVKAQSERTAIEKFKKHASMAKIINVKEVPFAETSVPETREPEGTGLSNELLAQYKKSAGISMRDLDKGGKYDKSNKRYGMVNRATKKQFINDLKQHPKEDVVTQGADSTSPVGGTNKDITESYLNSLKRAGYDIK